MELSRWLATQKPPIALPPLKSLAPAPVLVPGAVVTLWPYRPPLGEPGPEQVAAVLRRLHSLPAPPSTIPVPSYRPLHRLDEALAVDAARKHPVLTPQDTRWLIEQARLLRNELEELPRTDHALVHGDAHPENLLPTGHGWLLIDWDGACLGPRVLDLLPTGFPGRFARPDASDRRLFWGAYGPSTHHEQEVRVLQAIGELHSLGAYLRLAADSPAHADQLQLRIRSLVNDDPTALWRPVR
ncbi:Phosphotransferase enzyme family protein [Actinosynnema pretiosum]|nr:Phosphotransferase enzyme family protein [Actinosynnema pretiosum]